MLRQGGAVVEAFVHVLAGGLGRTAEGALIEAVASFQAAAVTGTDAHAAGAVAAFVADVFEAETAGGEFVVVFVCGRSDGAAFKPDAVGCDVVAAFALLLFVSYAYCSINATIGISSGSESER